MAVAEWAVTNPDEAEQWDWKRDDRWAKVKRFFVCQRFHSWTLNTRATPRRLCSACRVRWRR